MKEESVRKAIKDLREELNALRLKQRADSKLVTSESVKITKQHDKIALLESKVKMLGEGLLMLRTTQVNHIEENHYHIKSLYQKLALLLEKAQIEAYPTELVRASLRKLKEECDRALKKLDIVPTYIM